jgi:acyl carrier protein
MGLDSVELLVEVEKKFNIQILGCEAEKIYTVKDFHNTVWGHLNQKENSKCISKSLFYMLRKTFAENFKIQKGSLHPASSLNIFFPEKNRIEIWNNMQDESKLKFPGLRLSNPWSDYLNYFAFFSIVISLGMSLFLIILFDYSYWLFTSTVAGILLTFLFSKILDSKRTSFGGETLRSLTLKVLALNYESLSKEIQINRAEMESIINHIISERCGMEINEITPDKRITDDLGID